MDTQQTAAVAVLVVDDDEVIRETMRDALADEGYTVYAVPDGTPALQRMQEHPEGLVVVLDLTTTCMDGLAVLCGVSVPATASPDSATGYCAIPTGTRHDALAPPAAPSTYAELVTLSATFLPHPVSMAALVCAVAEAAACATSRTRSSEGVEEEEEEEAGAGAGETVGRGEEREWAEEVRPMPPVLSMTGWSLRRAYTAPGAIQQALRHAKVRQQRAVAPHWPVMHPLLHDHGYDHDAGAPGRILPLPLVPLSVPPDVRQPVPLRLAPPRDDADWFTADPTTSSFAILVEAHAVLAATRLLLAQSHSVDKGRG